MVIQSATLTSDQYTSVRGNHSITAYVVPNPNTTVLACRVNGTPSGASFAQVTFDGVTTGAYTDAKVGYTVLFCKTNDKRQSYLRTRVRTAPTSSVLYIDRNSENIEDNDYIFVIKDVALHRKAPRDVSGTVYFDEDVAFRQLVPLVYNLESAYAKITTSNWDFAFAPLAKATTSGATISTWAWDADGGSFQSGSSSSQNVTIRYTSAGVYYPRVTVTDSAGRTNFFTMMVCCESTDLSNIIALNVTDIQISKSLEGGASCTLSAQAESRFTDMLDLTQICIFSVEKYGSSSTPILTNMLFVGRLRNPQVGIQSSRSGVTSSVRYEVEGINKQLDRLRLATIAILDNASPSAYGDVKDLTLWRAFSLVATELMTLSNICAISFDDTSNDYAIPSIGTQKSDKAGGMLDSIAEPNNSVINYLPSGEIYVARHVDFISTTDRASLVLPANLTDADWSDKLDINIDPAPKLAVLIAYGGTYNTTTRAETAYRATAPAQSWGAGESQEQLNRQVLIANLSDANAKSALASRAGNAYSARSPRYSLSAQFSGGYHWMQPISNQRWTITVDGDDNDNALTFGTSDYWILQSVSITYNQERYLMEVSATFIAQCDEGSSLVFVEPAPDDAPYQIPTIPPFNPYNPDLVDFNPDIWYPDGDVPDDYEGAETPQESWNTVMRPASPQKKKAISAKSPDTGCKALSINFRDPNETLSSFFGTNLKEYVITVNGSAQIQPAGGGAPPLGWTRTFDFAANDGGFTQVSAPSAVYTSSVGWSSYYPAPADPPAKMVGIEFDFGGTYTVTKVVFNVTFTNGTEGGVQNTVGYYKDTASVPNFVLLDGNPANGDLSLVWTGSASFSKLIPDIRVSYYNAGNGECIVKSITIEGTGTVPSWATAVGWSKTFDFTASNGGWAASAGATYSAGVGWIQGNYTDGFGNYYTGLQIYRADSPDFTVTSASITYDLVTGSSTSAINNTSLDIDGNAVLLEAPNTTGTNKTQSASFSYTTPSVYVQINASVRNDATYGGGTIVLKSVTLSGTGTAPSWGDSIPVTAAVFGDAFYQWEEGSTASLYSSGFGFLVDNALPGAVPLYNPNHIYPFDYTGDGTNISFKYVDADHTDNENKLLYIQVCAKDGSGVP